MAREVLTIGGAIVGGMFGAPQLGFMIGSLVGNAVDPVTIKGPSLGDAKLQNVSEGSPIPRVWGRAAVAGTVVDRSEPRIIKRKQSQGKGGPTVVEERMLISFAIAFSEPVNAITRIWENDKLVYDVTGTSLVEDGAGIAGKFVFYSGAEDQLPDSTFEAVHGVGNAPAYRGVSRVVFTDYDVTEKGQAIPRYLFEVSENNEAPPAATSVVLTWSTLSIGEPGYPAPGQYHPTIHIIGPYAYPVSISVGAGGAIADDQWEFNGQLYGESQIGVGALSGGTFITNLAVGQVLRIRIYNLADVLCGGIFRASVQRLSVGDPTTALLSDIVTDLHARVGQGASDIDVSELTDEVQGFAYAGKYSVAEAIRQLQRTYLFGSFAADLKIRYPKRGGANVFALTDDDLLEDPDILERKQEIELPRVLHVQYQDWQQNYAAVKATSRRISPDVRVVGEAGIETAVVMTSSEAYNLARKLHNVAWVELNGEFTVKIPARKYSWITPTDCGAITFRGITKRVVVQRIEEADGVMTLTVMHDRQSAYQADATPPILRAPLPPPDDRIGTTYWEWLNIPALRDEDDRLVTYVAAAGSGAGWTGALFQRSIDSGATYGDKADLSAAIIGEVITGIAAANPAYADDTNVLTVQLYNTSDTLETITGTQLLQELNAAIVGDEIIQFRDATETTEGVWELSYLLRGRLATDAVAHVAGERFVLLDGVSAITEGAGSIGQTFTQRAVGYGSTAESATVVAEAWTPARSQIEWAPEFLELTRDGSNISATWVQRHRFGSAINPVPSQYFDGYRVTMTGPSSTLTFDVNDSGVAFDPVDTTALGSPVTVTVAGLNTITGVSPLTAQASI